MSKKLKFRKRAYDETLVKKDAEQDTLMDTFTHRRGNGISWMLTCERDLSAGPVVTPNRLDVRHLPCDCESEAQVCVRVEISLRGNL